MFDEVEARRVRLDAYRPFSDDVRRRLDELFEPWFIFSSNAIEGNTLSLGDTIYLLREGILPAGKREEEYLEVKGQEDAYAYLQESVRGQFPLSEKLVRELHVLLTNKLNPAKFGPGQYKTRDNQVRHADGALFPYVPAIDTAAAMQALIEWYVGPGQQLHPIERAARLHYKFILIHPFLDGNGRTARLLANLALLQAGYVMVVFRAQDPGSRRVYLDALRAVDTSVPIGDLRPDNEALNAFPFVTYLEHELLWSYDRALDVLEGRLAVTTEDLVRQFAGFERRVLEDQGIAADGAAQIALLAERVDRLTTRIFDQLATIARELSARWTEYELDVQRASAPAAEALEAPTYSYRLKALELEHAPRTGRAGVVYVSVRVRRDSSVGAPIPRNECEFIAMAEPHRMIIGGFFQARNGGPSQYEHIGMRTETAGWNADIEMFIARFAQRFLFEVEAAALRSDG